jgi:hypothetical protein
MAALRPPDREDRPARARAGRSARGPRKPRARVRAHADAGRRGQDHDEHRARRRPRAARPRGLRRVARALPRARLRQEGGRHRRRMQPPRTGRPGRPPLHRGLPRGDRGPQSAGGPRRQPSALRQRAPHRPATDPVASRDGRERPRAPQCDRRARRAAGGDPARDGLRHHRRVRGDGDALPRRGRGGSPRAHRPPARRVQLRGRAGDGAIVAGDGCDARTAPRRAVAEPRADARGDARPRPRRSLREHRARLQLRGGDTNRAAPRGVGRHRGRLRVRPRCREVLRHQVPRGAPRARSGRARRDAARAEAPRRELPRRAHASGPGGRFARAPEPREARRERALLRPGSGRGAQPLRERWRGRDPGRAAALPGARPPLRPLRSLRARRRRGRGARPCGRRERRAATGPLPAALRTLGARGGEDPRGRARDVRRARDRADAERAPRPRERRAARLRGASRLHREDRGLALGRPFAAGPSRGLRPDGARDPDQRRGRLPGGADGRHAADAGPPAPAARRVDRPARRGDRRARVCGPGAGVRRRLRGPLSILARSRPGSGSGRCWRCHRR